jgi:hypothetical protein
MLSSLIMERVGARYKTTTGYLAKRKSVYTFGTVHNKLLCERIYIDKLYIIFSPAVKTILKKALLEKLIALI